MCVVEGTKMLQTPTVHLSSTTRRAILHYEGTFRGEGGQPALLHTCLARVTKMCGRLSRHARSIDLCLSFNSA